MISRYVPVGLLCLAFFLGCKTADVVESKKEIKDPVAELILKYSDKPEILLEKILPYTKNNDFKYNDLLARLYLYSGDFDMAITVIESIPDYNKSDDLLEIKAVAMLSKGNDITNIIEDILTITKTNYFAVKYKSNLEISRKNYKNAETVIIDYLDNGGNKLDVYIILGDIELSKVDNLNLKHKKVLNENEERVVYGFYNNALNYYLRAEGCETAEYFLKIANIYKKLGEKFKAVEAMDRVIELEPDNPWNYYDRGKLLFYMDSPDRCESDMLKVLELDPDHFFANIFLGRLYYNTNKPSNSLEYYNRALSINPDYTPAFKDLSVLYFITGKPEVGLSFLTKLYKTGSDRDPYFPLYLVNYLYETGKEHDAIKILEKLVKYEKNGTIKELYKYYLNPGRTGDDILNKIIYLDNKYTRLRLSYYVAAILEREGIKAVSRTIYLDVADSTNVFESMLARYKLGDFSE